MLRANRADDVLYLMMLTGFAGALFLSFSQLVCSKDAVPAVGSAVCFSITRNSFHLLLFLEFQHVERSLSRLRRLRESILKMLANLFAVLARGVRCEI
jgi:hypothetical protein